MKERKSWIAFLAVLVLFACKGESPTAPPTGGGPPTTPPTNATVTVTASNTDPLVDSSVVLTATVSIGGQAAPNGTAVQFNATSGSLDGTSESAIIKTTTDGVATVTLTSASPGLIRVTVAVNNVTRTVDVTFRSAPITPPLPSTAPTITSITPSIGRPTGGQTIRITGTNFKSPIKVLFDTGQPLPVGAFVVSATETAIDVITPSVNLGAGQQLAADVIVITQSGSSSEQRVESAAGFTFRSEQLTPKISTASPNSGPVTGGTRVTIFGEGFQAPVQVFFGTIAGPIWAEARVVSVNFSQIIVETPNARDTSPAGSETVTGPVDVRVVNINSATSVEAGNLFRYINALQVTNVSPIVGPSTGGTDITIDGVGFLAPVDVNIGGVQAQVLSVSGTRLRVRTGALASPCVGGVANILITNVVNGDTFIYGDAPEENPYTYVPVVPRITGVSDSSPTPGQSISVTVRDPGVGPTGFADIRFTINGKTVIPSPSTITAGSGLVVFTMAVPATGFTFPTVSCTTADPLPGTQLGPLEVPLVFTNITTGCADTTSIQIDPPTPNPCVAAPPVATVTNPASGSCLEYGDVAVAGGSSTLNIVVANSAPAGSQNLTITGATVPSGSSDYSVTNVFPLTLAPGQTGDIPVTFDPTAAGTRNGTIRLSTNDPAHPTIDVCATGNGT